MRRRNNRFSWLWLLIIVGILVSLPAPTWAQRKARSRTATTKKSKAQLERERRTTLRRIKETSRILAQTQQKKEASIGQLNALKEKLVVQQSVIHNISTELKTVEADVQQTEGQVQQTRQSLDQLKAEYARLIYAASKTANSYNRLMFVFAAESFNQLMLRLRYIRQYSEVRKAQAAEITAAQQKLNHQLAGLNQQRTQKSTLLSSQITEKGNLLNLKSQQDQVVTKLSQQEQGLRAELARRQRAVQQLDELIAVRVREEIARAARVAAAARASRAAARTGGAGATSRTSTAEADAAASRVDRVTLTPETAALSSSFADNRGQLLWPVARGFVSQHFGRHPHPVLKNVVVENRGVDIQTNAGEPVRAIFDGKVLTVSSIPGMNNIVMIQHGEYFTVYAKLRSVSVREGQTVSARQPIGTVYTSSDGTSEVQFQLWRNSANLNPETWLGRK